MTDGDEEGFLWGDERLESASQEELTDHIKELQDELQRIEDEVGENRELMHFLLDVWAGEVEAYLPDTDERDTDDE